MDSIKEYLLLFQTGLNKKNAINPLMTYMLCKMKKLAAQQQLWKKRKKEDTILQYFILIVAMISPPF
jgi:hypothetical protein